MRLLHPTASDLSPDDLLDLYDTPGPYLRAGFVSSVDGAIAVGGRSGPLSSPADKAVFQALRAVSDAVIVGAGTARGEDYGPVRFSSEAAAWRTAHNRSAQVPLVVVSRRGEVPATSRFFQGPVILAVPVGVEASVPSGEVLHVSGAPALVAALHDRGFTRLLCEGGPSLLTTLVGSGLVTELCLSTSPQLVGGDGPSLLGALPAAVRLELASLLVDDPGVLAARWTVVPSLS